MVSYYQLPELKNGCVYNSCEIVDNKLFVFGGCDMKGKALNSAQYINLLNREHFINIKDIPRIKAGSAIVHIDQKILTIGGIYDKQCQLDKVDEYDIGSDSWSELQALPNPTQGSLVVARNNVVYCAGGLSTGMTTMSNFGMLDKSIGRWQGLPSMPTPHFGAGAFLHNDNFYVIGGRLGKLSTGFCNCYDFRARAWRALPAVPADFRNIFSGYVVLDGQVFVIGGLNEIPSQGFSNLVYKFDMETEKWQKMSDILKPRADFGAFGIDNQLIIAGGMGLLQGLSATVENYSTRSGRWSLLDDMPTVHASSSKCVTARSMFLVSGMSNTGPSKSVTELVVH